MVLRDHQVKLCFWDELASASIYLYQSINAVSAARATLGLDAEIVELKTPLKLIAQMKDGMATGEVLNWRELVD